MYFSHVEHFESMQLLETISYMLNLERHKTKQLLQAHTQRRACFA